MVVEVLKYIQRRGLSLYHMYLPSYQKWTQSRLFAFWSNNPVVLAILDYLYPGFRGSSCKIQIPSERSVIQSSYIRKLLFDQHHSFIDLERFKTLSCHRQIINFGFWQIYIPMSPLWSPGVMAMNWGLKMLKVCNYNYPNNNI